MAKSFQRGRAARSPQPLPRPMDARRRPVTIPTARLAARHRTPSPRCPLAQPTHGPFRPAHHSMPAWSPPTPLWSTAGSSAARPTPQWSTPALPAATTDHWRMTTHPLALPAPCHRGQPRICRKSRRHASRPGGYTTSKCAKRVFLNFFLKFCERKILMTNHALKVGNNSVTILSPK